MKYFFFGCLLLCLGCSQKQNSTQVTLQDSLKQTEPGIAPATTLVTDTSIGAIHRTTTYTDLQKAYGDKSLQDTIDYVAEGTDSFIVTKIYSNTPNELVVTWQKSKFHTGIAAVDCLQENSPYQTADSLKVGSTLEKLVQVNGKKINFSGTGWDYGGNITSYNKGKFEKSNIFFSLDSRDDAENVMGDQELNTDQPKVKPNLKKLFISRISVSLNNEK